MKFLFYVKFPRAFFLLLYYSCIDIEETLRIERMMLWKRMASQKGRVGMAMCKKRLCAARWPNHMTDLVSSTLV